MACYHPLRAYQRASGDVVFAERGDIQRTLELPCGQCIGCRLERSRQWAVRCLHEASLYGLENSFITLTYDDKWIPSYGSLNYPDFQRFMKRVRARFRARVRFFMCGEYGEELLRPHYHALLFGLRFPDLVKWSKGPSGAQLYRSDMLDSLWPYGFASVGDVTFESAGYVARYCMKKVTGDAAEEHYRVVDISTGEVHQRVPEFAHMSLKPGIGARWLEKWQRDVYPAGKVVVNGKRARAPRYYDKRFEKLDGDAAAMLGFERYLSGIPYASEQSDERLAVRETVQTARAKALKRSI